MMICSVCHQNQSSYKCPKCNEPYCCLGCYKIHKTLCLGTKIDESQKDDVSVPQVSVPPFELFRSNQEIIKALGDPRLQKIIVRIDSSRNREDDLIKEMNINPEFKYFVELLLKNAPSTILP